MAATQHELDEHLKAVRKQVKQPNLEYITVAGIEVSATEIMTPDSDAYHS
jgi:hypothetical protein